MKPTFAENCYLILGEPGRVYLLFPVVRVLGRPVWYSLCSVICGPEARDKICNETIFTKEGVSKNGDYYRANVYGMLKVETDVVGRLGLRFGPNSPPFRFYLADVTVPEPVDLPFAQKVFLLKSILLPF